MDIWTYTFRISCLSLRYPNLSSFFVACCPKARDSRRRRTPASSGSNAESNRLSSLRTSPSSGPKALSSRLLIPGLGGQCNALYKGGWLVEAQQTFMRCSGPASKRTETPASPVFTMPVRGGVGGWFPFMMPHDMEYL